MTAWVDDAAQVPWRRWLTAGLVLVACLAGAGTFVAFRAHDALTTSPSEAAAEQRVLDQRLDSFRAVVGPEPSPPPGARRLDRNEYTGDLVSDGPAIEWTYSFAGSAADFLRHYEETLPAAGWSTALPGNMPGILGAFEKAVGERSVTLIVWDDFRLLALPGGPVVPPSPSD